ncbi:MAG: glycosyltransferase family 2 protein, partial [Planctomycetota bacterium]
MSRVTIGIPVYNGQEFLESAVAAILTQTFADFELVISDNCSSDSTPEICQRLAESDSRIRIVRQKKNLGAIGNFNSLVHLANGEYFKWAACDDLMEPTFLQRCVEALDQDHSLSWCHCKSDMINSDGRSIREILPRDDLELELDSAGNPQWIGHPRRNFDSIDPIARFRGVILGTNWCVDSYGLIRLSALKQTRLLQTFYGAEKVLMGEISLVGRYYEVPELLFYQRIHQGASSYLSSAESQAEFAVTRNKSPFLSSRLPILKAHLDSISHANLTLSQKLRGYGCVLEYLCQFKKLGDVMNRLVRGTGIGAGGKR